VITAESTILNPPISYDEQVQLVAEIREIRRAAPLFQPFAGGLGMSVRITNAGPWGWTADGLGYRYTDRHPEGQPWPRIPRLFLDVAERYGVDSSRIDCAHIVVYGPGAKLGKHQDRTEHDRTGDVFTVPLGDPCQWIVWDPTTDTETRAVLYSGHPVLLAGPSRAAFHSVRRVLAPDPMFHPSPLDRPGRIALSLRQGAGPR